MRGSSLPAPGSANSIWGHLLVEELARLGIHLAFIAPGSRSTPIVMALARHPRIKSFIHFDERGLAFAALGYARASHQPALIITTSGTAVANLFPALVEAAMDHLPLIVITADRPPELLDAGANQTIDQVKIFGDYALWQCDLPCPDWEVKPEVLLTTIDQAVYRATRPPRGVVHINCRFREPFLPPDFTITSDTTDDLNYINRIEKMLKAHTDDELQHSYTTNIKPWLTHSTPYTTYSPLATRAAPAEIAIIKEIIAGNGNGMIICGSGGDLESAMIPLEELLQQLGWPVFADIRSPLRWQSRLRPLIHYHDLLLLSPVVRRQFRPTTIIQLGAAITSKRLLTFIAELTLENYLIVHPCPERRDPGHKATRYLECSLTEFCRQLRAEMDVPCTTSDSLDYLRTASDTTGNYLKQCFSNPDEILTEPMVAHLLSQHLPPDSGLFLASSMPIRDLDMFAALPHRPIRVAANRGASGIDGTLATAVGFACGLNNMVTLLIGDLALLHDLNSLAMIRNSACQIIMIVINNHGGGIFSFLPVANHPEVFESHFGTRHPWQFANAAAQFDWSYERPQTGGEFVTAYDALVASGSHGIIEINTDRRQNVEEHRRLQTEIIAILDKIKPL